MCSSRSSKMASNKIFLERVVHVVRVVLSRFLSFVWLFFSDFLIFLISNWTHPKDDAGCGYYYLFFFQSERGDQNTPRRGKTL